MSNQPTVVLELDLDRVQIIRQTGTYHVGSWVTIYVVDDGPGSTGEVSAILLTKGETTVTVGEP